MKKCRTTSENLLYRRWLISFFPWVDLVDPNAIPESGISRFSCRVLQYEQADIKGLLLVD